MTKFCGCNSEWEIGVADFPVTTKSHQLTIGPMHTQSKPQLCRLCQLYKWYNPQYENMMFDLKRMNQ